MCLISVVGCWSQKGRWKWEVLGGVDSRLKNTNIVCRWHQIEKVAHDIDGHFERFYAFEGKGPRLSKTKLFIVPNFNLSFYASMLRKPQNWKIWPVIKKSGNGGHVPQVQCGHCMMVPLIKNRNRREQSRHRNFLKRPYCTRRCYLGKTYTKRGLYFPNVKKAGKIKCVCVLITWGSYAICRSNIKKFPRKINEWPWGKECGGGGGGGELEGTIHRIHIPSKRNEKTTTPALCIDSSL